jgi:hypothetical protein
MDQRFRRGFTAAEKTEVWDRWQRGESLKAIGRAFGKPSSSIYFQVAPHGRIRPAPRRRSRLAPGSADQYARRRRRISSGPVSWPDRAAAGAALRLSGQAAADVARSFRACPARRHHGQVMARQRDDGRPARAAMSAAGARRPKRPMLWMDFFLDERGYLPFAQSEGQFLFHLVSQLIVTTNLACPVRVHAV